MLKLPQLEDNIFQDMDVLALYGSSLQYCIVLGQFPDSPFSNKYV